MASVDEEPEVALQKITADPEVVENKKKEEKEDNGGEGELMKSDGGTNERGEVNKNGVPSEEEVSQSGGDVDSGEQSRTEAEERVKSPLEAKVIRQVEVSRYW